MCVKTDGYLLIPKDVYLLTRRSFDSAGVAATLSMSVFGRQCTNGRWFALEQDQ